MSSPTRANPETPHLTEEQMLLYQNRALAVEDLLSADRHLGSCGRCRRIMLARMGPVPLPREVEHISEPLHLSYEQIAKFLDGTLTAAEKARAEAHFFLCAGCSRELEGLKRLDMQLVAAPASSPAQVQSPGQTSKAPAVVPFTRRIAEFFAVPGRIRDFGLAFGAMAAGLLVMIQANYVTNPAVGGSRDAARLLMPDAHGHPGLGMGGIVLLFLGAGYLLYSLRRKK